MEIPVYPGLVICLLCVSALLSLPPRANPEAYPVRATPSGHVVGAEYQGRGITVKSASWLVGDYLAVEIGIFPDRQWTGPVSTGDFQLRINRAAVPLLSAPASVVAASLRNNGLNPYRGVQATAGAGPADVVFGGPRRPTEERFPGDPQARQPRRPTQAPDAVPVEREAQVSESQAVLEYALPEGEVKQAVAGFVFFHYPGKKKIRSLELLYRGTPLPLL